MTTELASADGPAQPSWRSFEQDQLQHLHEADRAGQRNPSEHPPALPGDITVLYADPSHPGTWARPSDPDAVPLLMRWNDTIWRVLHYGSTQPPPG